MNATDPMNEDQTPQEQPTEPEATSSAVDEIAAAAAQAGLEIAADNREELAQLQSELAVAKDQAIRAAAEVENMRKRTAREMDDTRKFAVSGFAKELVDVLDNLHRACESIPEEERSTNAQLASLATGVEMTLKSLETAFGKFGIMRIQPMGEKFDPNLHQAVVQVEDSEAEAGTVVQVLQAGYTLHERLLRPAMVGVAKSDKPTVDTQV